MSKTQERSSGFEVARLFGKWDYEGVEVLDIGLKRYLSLRPGHIPHTGGRHEHQRFRKSELSPVERLVNNLMRPGKAGGKKDKARKIVQAAFELIHLRTGKNPIEVLVRAIENSAPCEDTTRIRYGGIVYLLSVDMAPQRRADLALRLLAEGARRSAFGSPKTIEECLADELIAASNRDSKSYAVAKRDEIERVARSSR